MHLQISDQYRDCVVLNLQWGQNTVLSNLHFKAKMQLATHTYFYLFKTLVGKFKIKKRRL